MQKCHFVTIGHFIFTIIIMQTLWLCVCINFWGVCVPLVTYTIMYYQCMYSHVDHMWAYLLPTGKSACALNLFILI